MLWRVQPMSVGASVFTETGEFVAHYRDASQALDTADRHNRTEAEAEIAEHRDASRDAGA